MIPCRTKLWRPSVDCEKHFAERAEEFRPIWHQAENRDPSTYEILMRSFAWLPYGHPLKYEFLLLLWQHQWEGDLQLENAGTLNHWAIRMARAFCHWKRLNLCGCGSSGKTALCAAYCYTAWKTQPFNSSVFLSTTSAEAGESRTWGAVKDWHQKDRIRVGKRIESLHLITLDEELRDDEGVKNRDLRDVIKCVNIKSGQEGKNVVASIVGRKNDNVIWHIDEFNFMDIGVLNARVNLNTNPFNQVIGSMNAPEEGDPGYIDAEPFGPQFPDGWRSVDKENKFGWTTRAGYCLYFNGEDSPNYRAKSGIPFPKLMNEQFRRDIEKDAGGEDAPYYWKQFYGFPPGVDISDKAFTMKLLAVNHAFEAPEWASENGKIFAGLDLGFKKDGDPSVIQFGRLGKSAQNRTILALEGDAIKLVPSQKSDSPYEEQIAKLVISYCANRDCHDLALDVTGDGGILLQHIEREARAQGYRLNVLPVSFSGTAEDRIIIPGERRTAREMFDRMVTQIWISFRVSVLNDVIRGMRDRAPATNQLCSRRMGTDEKKRQTIEPKKEMKKRLKRSPDEGDALCLLHFIALRNGLSGAEVKKKAEEFNPVALLENRKPTRYTQHRTIYAR